MYNKGKTYKVTAIGELGFNGCTAITEVYIPETVTTIGGEAFYGCTGMRSVYIPGSVTLIGAGAFSNCTALEKITIPESVTAINTSTFSRCTALKDFTIPGSITSLGQYIFSRSTGLETLTSYADPSKGTMANNVFYGMPIETCELRVPKEYYDAYCQADQWKNFANIVPMETGGTVTGDELPMVGDVVGNYDQIAMCLTSGPDKWQFASCSASSGTFTFTIYDVAKTMDNIFKGDRRTGNNKAEAGDGFEMYPVADHEVVATQTFFNDDDKYEVIISFRGNDYKYTHKVYNEDGEYLLTLPFTSSGAKMLVLGQNRYLIQSGDGARKVYHVHKSSLPVPTGGKGGDVDGNNVINGSDVTSLYNILLK